MPPKIIETSIEVKYTETLNVNKLKWKKNEFSSKLKLSFIVIFDRKIFLDKKTVQIDKIKPIFCCNMATFLNKNCFLSAWIWPNHEPKMTKIDQHFISDFDYFFRFDWYMFDLWWSSLQNIWRKNVLFSRKLSLHSHHWYWTA